MVHMYDYHNSVAQGGMKTSSIFPWHWFTYKLHQAGDYLQLQHQAPTNLTPLGFSPNGNFGLVDGKYPNRDIGPESSCTS